MLLAPVLAVSACCHTASEPTAPVEKFVPTPTAEARTGFEKVVADLKGEDLPGAKSPIGQSLVQTLRGGKIQNLFPELEEEFINNLHCKQLGCYAELIADSPAKAVKINEFVTDPRTPLGLWKSWRFVSGMYQGSAQGGTDQQRRIAVVVLDRRPYQQVRK
jgi:hypothetical protein